jgi:hypothetical protein
MKKRIKLGVVANEFFELSLGRMGGFGWSTRQVAKCFGGDPSLGVDVVFLAGETYGTPEQPESTIHNTRIILRQKNRLEYCRRIWAEGFDLILSIDYRPNYRSLFWTRKIWLKLIPREFRVQKIFFPKDLNRLIVLL